MLSEKPIRLLVALVLMITVSMPVPAPACCLGDRGHAGGAECACCVQRAPDDGDSCCCGHDDLSASSSGDVAAADPHHPAGPQSHQPPPNPCSSGCPCAPGATVTLTLPLVGAQFDFTPDTSPLGLPAAESLPLLLLPGGVFRPPRS